MRTGSVVVAVVVVVTLVLGAATNPSQEDFATWYESHVRTEASSKSGLSKIPAFVGGFARLFQARMTVRRQNLILFSLYHVRVLGEDRTYLGAFGQFAGVK